MREDRIFFQDTLPPPIPISEIEIELEEIEESPPVSRLEVIVIALLSVVAWTLIVEGALLLGRIF
jgi:hypothetical protein